MILSLNPAYSSDSRGDMVGGDASMLNLRGSISVKQNMPVFQVLWVGACLKMLLEGVAALEGRDGGGVNGRRAGLSHFVVW